MTAKIQLLMVDNYDSFTFNIVQYFGELGAEVTVVRNDEITVDEIQRRFDAGEVDRLVISPGPCSPTEAGISVAAIQHFSGQLPILGVCLGHQAIGAAFGGKVVRAQQLMHGKTSVISTTQEGVFAGLPERFTVNRYHSLAIEREIVGLTHDELGAELARHWNLPVEIIVAIRFHHDSTKGDPAQPLARIINLAEKLLPSFGFHEIIDTTITPEDWQALGIDPERAEDISAQVIEQAEQASQFASSFS